MTSFSRGRGISRINSENESSKEAKVPPPTLLCKQLYFAINEMNVDKLKENLAMLAKEDENAREECLQYLLKAAYEIEDFNKSFSKFLKQFFHEWSAQITTVNLRTVTFRWLQQKYEIDTKDRNDKCTFLKYFSLIYLSALHNYGYGETSCCRNILRVLVAEFINSSEKNNTGYNFLVEPIINMFEYLFNSTNHCDVYLVAVLFARCWIHLKATNLEAFDKFRITLRKLLLKKDVLEYQKHLVLFLIDLSNLTVAEPLSTSLCEFYRKLLTKTVKDQFLEWPDLEYIQKMLKDDENNIAVEKSLSDVKISEKTENTEENQKPVVPRAIRGAGATDK